MFVLLYNCRKTKNKKLKEVVIMIMFMFVFFVLVGCVLWFVEETKIGRKLADKIYNNIMKK